MPFGSLSLNITDLRREPVRGSLRIQFRSGSIDVEAVFDAPGDTVFNVEGIPCRSSAGDVFEVSIKTANYRTYRFFQMIGERVNTPSDNAIELAARPARVRAIEAADFDSLPPELTDILNAAQMAVQLPEDRPLRGLAGRDLYNAIMPMQRACLLNLWAKARHTTSDNCFRFVRGLRILRQDRCFAEVDPTMPEFLRQSPRFKSAPGGLHEPLPGFRREDSFKSRDAHANLQVTFMRHPGTGQLAADIDIDEATGIEHGFEVLRNHLTNGSTNPYQVRELLLLADLEEQTLDPGYRFIFAGEARA